MHENATRTLEILEILEHPGKYIPASQIKAAIDDEIIEQRLRALRLSWLIDKDEDTARFNATYTITPVGVMVREALREAMAEAK